jgi:hypothetical protein
VSSLGAPCKSGDFPVGANLTQRNTPAGSQPEPLWSNEIVEGYHQEKLKRRNAVEPVIGHMKNDGRLCRNELGDAIIALLCGAGHNLRRILRQLAFLFPLPVRHAALRSLLQKFLVPHPLLILFA